ncbi:hypothetical protein [Nitrosomonas sp. Nm34]|uniref:hypothetical protein n=1 Tax=Nitrosomonas sp. Nm34 TaxID=1881055 RepID=UPI0008E9A709|nr:hypothetical protein [Nitrosomonas sp. Nm34]SFJ02365.1 hypothetical protein SAMN05428978_108412 [Nitrosomonas sp. Nm34]
MVPGCFGNSGSTLIAAEKQEVAASCWTRSKPKYGDVILRCWQDWAGKQAVLAGCEQTFAEVLRSME